ncbi:MAG TPA: serine/threonine-protein kinase [Fimbriiglobus sp.]
MSNLHTFSDYRLLRSLGGGSGATVFLAEANDGKPVAIKLIESNDPEGLIRFRREIVVGLTVSHPHLVRVLHGNSISPPYYLVMELVSGESLRARMDRRGRIAPLVALGIARQLAEALASLHASGFVHGDVKPGNVMLPSAGRAVLVDLGFAHRPGELEFVLGTANYLAPELCRAPAEDSYAIDVYALGVSLFEMLTNTRPYPDGTQSGVMRSHRDIEPDRLTDHRGKWPKPLVSLVEKLLANDPAVRLISKEAVRGIAEVQIELMKRAA